MTWNYERERAVFEAEDLADLETLATRPDEDPKLKRWAAMKLLGIAWVESCDDHIIHAENPFGADAAGIFEIEAKKFIAQEYAKNPDLLEAWWRDHPRAGTLERLAARHLALQTRPHRWLGKRWVSWREDFPAESK